MHVEYNIKMEVDEIGYGDVDQIMLAEDKNQLVVFVNTVIKLHFSQLLYCRFASKCSFPWSRSVALLFRLQVGTVTYLLIWLLALIHSAP